MTQQKMNHGGRPNGYSIDQVRAVFGKLILGGEAITDISAKSTKAGLVSDFGVSDGIDVRSLETMVEFVRREAIQSERELLIRSLPTSVDVPVQAMIEDLRQNLLILLARQRNDFQVEANRACQDLTQDKKNANWRIAELEGLLDAETKTVGQITQERDAARAEAVEAAGERDAAQSMLAMREREADPMNRLIAQLQDPSVRSDIRDMLADIAGEVPRLKSA